MWLVDWLSECLCCSMVPCVRCESFKGHGWVNTLSAGVNSVFADNVLVLHSFPSLNAIIILILIMIQKCQEWMQKSGPNQENIDLGYTK